MFFILTLGNFGVIKPNPEGPLGPVQSPIMKLGLGFKFRATSHRD